MVFHFLHTLFFFPIIYSIRAGTIIISAYLFFFFYLSTYEQAIRDADSDPESEPI